MGDAGFIPSAVGISGKVLLKKYLKGFRVYGLGPTGKCFYGCLAACFLAVLKQGGSSDKALKNNQTDSRRTCRLATCRN